MTTEASRIAVRRYARLHALFDMWDIVRSRMRARPQRPKSAVTIADFDIDIEHLSEKRRTARLVVFSLFVVGVFLLYEASRRPPGTTSQFMLSHFGVGLIVGSIAGFGFDIFAHHVDLQRQIYTLFRVNHRVAAMQLEAVLEKMVSNKPDDRHIHEELRKHLSTTVDSIGRIDAADIAASIVSLKFIARLLQYASDASGALANPQTRGEHIIVLPETAASLADEILAGHVQEMDVGDSYVVVSDFATWRRRQLSKFWSSFETRLEDKPIKVRRVFCFFDQDASLTAREALYIVRRHWCLAERMFDRLERQEVRYNVGVSFSTPREHFGVFKHRGIFTCFKPMGTGNLARITISSADETPEFEAIWQSTIRAFDEVEKGVVQHRFSSVRAELEKQFAVWFRGEFEDKTFDEVCDCTRADTDDGRV